MGRRTIDVVPPAIDDPSVIQHGRMPLVRLVPRQRLHVATVGSRRCSVWVGIGSNGLSQRQKPPRRDDMNASPPSGNGQGSKSSSGPVGQLPQLSAVRCRGKQMEGHAIGRKVIQFLRHLVGRRQNGPVDVPEGVVAVHRPHVGKGEIHRRAVVRQGRRRDKHLAATDRRSGRGSPTNDPAAPARTLRRPPDPRSCSSTQCTRAASGR